MCSEKNCHPHLARFKDSNFASKLQTRDLYIEGSLWNRVKFSISQHPCAISNFKSLSGFGKLVPVDANVPPEVYRF